MTDDAREATEALGYVEGGFMLFDTFRPEQPYIQVVHFAYRPLTPARKQRVLKRRNTTMEEGSKLAVEIVAESVAAWTVVGRDGEMVNPKDKRAIAEHVLDVIVEGVSDRVLDTAADEAAEAAVRGFCESRNVSL